MCDRQGARGAGGRGGRSLRWRVAFRCAVAAPLPHCPPAPLPAALAMLALLPSAGLTQETQDLEESRRRLEEIRRERDRLEEQRQRLQSQVHDVNDELHNLERQRQSTGRIVGEIERQIGGLSS